MHSLNGNEDLDRFIPYYGSTLIYKTAGRYQNIYVTERSEYEGKQGKFGCFSFHPMTVKES